MPADRLRRPLAIILLAAAAPAADLVNRDLTLALETEPTAFSWSVTRDGVRTTGSDAFTSHLAVVGGGRYSVTSPGSGVGLVIGVEGALARTTIDPSGELWWSEGRLVAGAGWAPLQGLTLGAVLRTGVGLDRMSVGGSQAFTTFDASGGHLAVAPELSLGWDVRRNLRLSIGAGWRWSRTTLTGHGVEIGIDQSGPTLSLGLAWALSDVPPSLE